MTSHLKFLGAVMLGASALFAGSASAIATASSQATYYYVEFHIAGSQVGLGRVHCADTPAEYVLLWGSDQGDVIVVGREDCPPGLPFP